MKHLFNIISILCLLGYLSVVKAEENPDIIRVKFTPEYAEQIEKHLAISNFTFKVNSPNNFRTGLNSLDSICQQLNALEIKRVFPYSRKFEKRHKKSGLHLWYEIKTGKGKSTETNWRNLGINKNILLIEEAKKAVLQNNVPVNDRYLSQQWHYNNTGQTGGMPGADINLFEAWQKTMGSRNIIVAVVDGGVEINHPDLVNNIWINEAELNGIAGNDNDENGYINDIYGWNFFNDSGIITGDDHGTHVAGIVGAETNNEIGIAGIAGGSGNNDGVRLMICQIGEATSAYVYPSPAMFAYAADNGAVIAQNSWVYGAAEEYDQAMLEGIDYFIENAGRDENGNPLPNTPMVGGIVFFGAGNNDTDEPYWPSCYEKVYAVTALNHNNLKASYSNYGDWIDICAPGGENNLNQGILSTVKTNYTHMSGTSMACPHVSGVAALILSAYGGNEYTPEMLWEKLSKSATPVDALNPEYSGQLGVGLINAGKALIEENPGNSYLNFMESGSFITYPNPFYHTIYIKDTRQNENIKIILYDLSGKILLHTEKNTQELVTLDLPTLASGIYQLHIVSPDRYEVKKIIKK